MTFRSFAAASRKRNIIPFGLLWGSLAWIEDNPSLPGVATVASSTTPVFDATVARFQKFTATADFAPSFLYNGSTTGVAGAEMSIRFAMSGGPWVASWPSNVSVSSIYALGPDVTIVNLWWNGSAWEMTTPAAENPA